MNTAITKLRHIKGSGGSNGLKRSIAYIMNLEKTEDGLLIGGNAGTTPEEVFEVMMETKRDWDKTEGRQGYHFIISWKPGEVSKMQAWDLANEFCERYLGDTYDYVFTIHTDRDHLHAHILFNSVSRVDGYKYHYKKGDWERYIQPVTDQICREQGLPVLDEQRTGKSLSSYAEHKAVKEGLPTLTGIVRADIDMMIRCSDSFPVFLLNMQKLGYRIRSGKHITYYPPGFTRGRRDSKLGEGYSKEEIISRIRTRSREQISAPFIMNNPRIMEMERKLRPYDKVRLPSLQLSYVKRINHVAHYLEAKNPFAVKWRTVRREAIDVGRIFEECMYLLEHDIRDPAHLAARYEAAGRKEQNIIRRIRNREAEVPVRQPVQIEPALKKPKSKTEIVVGRSI